MLTPLRLFGILFRVFGFLSLVSSLSSIVSSINIYLSSDAIGDSRTRIIVFIVSIIAAIAVWFSLLFYAEKIGEWLGIPDKYAVPDLMDCSQDSLPKPMLTENQLIDGCILIVGLYCTVIYFNSLLSDTIAYFKPQLAGGILGLLQNFQERRTEVIDLILDLTQVIISILICLHRVLIRNKILSMSKRG
jgi:hypothetical protein